MTHRMRWMTHRMIRVVCAIAAAWLLTLPAAFGQAPEIPASYKGVLTALGRQGDFKENVLKVNIPRNDVSVTVAGTKTPTPFGFGGWIAMTKGDGGMDVMMGDLVLLQDEVNPVMSALLENGIEVTALHNHFFWEEPRVFYMHVHGRGTPDDLARNVKPALDLIGKHGGTRTSATTPGAPAATSGTSGGGTSGGGTSASGQTPLNTSKLAQIVGHAGEQSGAVYKITVGRDDLKLTDAGAPINARMGLNTWAAFVGTDANAAIAGDVAMLEREITPVLKALRQHGLDVVAIHHHMTREAHQAAESRQTEPMVIFLHYWGTGPADKLATGFKAALDQLGHGGSHGGAR
jgi:hypothetical protein